MLLAGQTRRGFAEGGMYFPKDDRGFAVCGLYIIVRKTDITAVDNRYVFR
jgi:hypothetical protein